MLAGQRLSPLKPEAATAKPRAWTGSPGRPATRSPNTASLQRGATNFVNYCLGCHSLKYMRYSRMAKDLEDLRCAAARSLIPTGARPTDYMMSTFPAADAEAWFGKAPPDLSLTARAKGPDYIYQFLKGFYVDTTQAHRHQQSGARRHGDAGRAVGSGGREGTRCSREGPEARSGGKHVERFEQVAPGRLTPEEYDGFVRDTDEFPRLRRRARRRCSARASASGWCCSCWCSRVRLDAEDANTGRTSTDTAALPCGAHVRQDPVVVGSVFF